MSAFPLELDELSMAYGKKSVLDKVSLAIPEGAVYALLGRNGAGKSTMFRCALGMQAPTSGRALLYGEDAWTGRERAMRRVGVVFEDDVAPATMPASELARFCSRHYATWDQAGFDRRLDRFKVSKKTPFGRLSKGQKRQVALALALAPSPDFLVLDDPTLGLDIVARQEFFGELVAELAERGITVLVATHDITAVERFATHVAMLNDGAVTLNGSIDELRAGFRVVRWQGEVGPLARVLEDLRCVRTELRFGGVEAIVSRFEEAKLAPYRKSARGEVDVAQMTLEQIFTAISTNTERGAHL